MIAKYAAASTATNRTLSSTMSTPRNIELNCYAVVKATGREVQVTAKYTSRGSATTWGCDDGQEYQTHELRRCSKEVYEQIFRERLDAEMAEDPREQFLNSIRD